MREPELLLKTILRVIGTSSLFAILFILAPRDWMVEIHHRLGLGELPDGPVFGYLARSLSAFYAMQGGLLWVVSFHPRRYRGVLLYIGFATALLGVALIGIDWWEGLPLFWTVWEGPFVMAFGLMVFRLARFLRDEADRSV